jgi:hypothetical protein
LAGQGIRFAYTPSALQFIDWLRFQDKFLFEFFKRMVFSISDKLYSQGSGTEITENTATTDEGGDGDGIDGADSSITPQQMQLVSQALHELDFPALSADLELFRRGPSGGEAPEKAEDSDSDEEL